MKHTVPILGGNLRPWLWWWIAEPHGDKDLPSAAGSSASDSPFRFRLLRLASGRSLPWLTEQGSENQVVRDAGRKIEPAASTN